MSRHVLLVGLVALGLGSACSSEHDHASVQPAKASGATPVTPAKPHGNHDPAHGGVVMMVADLHFEAVIDPAGQHRVYWSTGAREPLPASAIEAVAITVKRPGAAPEQLTLARDPTDAFWVAAGAPLADPAAEVEVTFNRKGEPAATMPVFRKVAPAAPSAPAPATQPAHDHGAHAH